MEDHAPHVDPIATKLLASHRELLAFVEKRVGDRSLAEDLLQDAFVRGLDRAAALGDEESALRWFRRVLANAAIDHARRKATATGALEGLARELDAGGEASSEASRTVCRCVGDLADTLSPEYAAALHRIEIDGVSVKDFAAEAGITSANAAQRVLRARQALRERVVRACRTCAQHGCVDCTCARSEGAESRSGGDAA